MPAVTEYKEPQDSHEEYEGNAERAEMRRKFQRNWKYFLGDQKKALKVKEGEPDDNVIVNLVRMAADRTTSFLLPEMPLFEVSPDESRETEQEKFIRQCFEKSGGLTLLQKIALAGYIQGHVYVRVRPENRPGQNDLPRIMLMQPGTVVTYWRDGDYDDVLWHRQTWYDSDYNQHVIDFIRDGKNWNIREWNQTQRGWMLDNENVWVNSPPPIVQWQHMPNPAGFYGLSDASDLGIQDMVNLIESENAKIIRYHSSPRTIAVGVGASEIEETGIDQMWAIEDSNARVENLEMRSELKAARDMLNSLESAYMMLRRVTVLEGDIKDFQRVTDSGVRTVFMDMLKKRQVLMDLYGDGFATITEVLTDIKYGKPIRPDVKFVDPLPQDAAGKANVITTLRDRGVISRRTATAEAGYDPEEEMRFMANEAAEALQQDVESINVPEEEEGDTSE